MSQTELRNPKMFQRLKFVRVCGTASEEDSKCFASDRLVGWLSGVMQVEVRPLWHNV